MKTHKMDMQYVRIAELVENIKNVSNMISLHQKMNPQNNSMIDQYAYQKNEFVTELQSIFEELHLQINITTAA